MISPALIKLLHCVPNSLNCSQHPGYLLSAVSEVQKKVAARFPGNVFETVGSKEESEHCVFD